MRREDPHLSLSAGMKGGEERGMLAEGFSMLERVRVLSKGSGEGGGLGAIPEAAGVPLLCEEKQDLPPPSHVARACEAGERSLVTYTSPHQSEQAPL